MNARSRLSDDLQRGDDRYVLTLSRTQRAAVLDAQPVVVYKDDRRTRVCLVETPDARWVVKWFMAPRWRQALLWLLRRHPAQRERRAAQKVAAMGLPVVPIVSCGVRCGIGGAAGYLICPFRGESVFRQLNRRWLTRFDERCRLAVDLGRLTAAIVNRGLTHRDFKASNILRDESGRLWLIDTDRIVASRHGQDVFAMLAALDQTACRAGATRTERLRFVRSLLADAPHLGDTRSLVRSTLSDPIH